MIGFAIPITLYSLFVLIVSFSEHAWEFAVLSMIPSTIAGAIGAAVGRYGQSGIYGALLFSSLATEYSFLDRRNIWVAVGIVVFASIFGALVGEAGAVIGRSVSNAGEKGGQLQRSRAELVVHALLVAILAICGTLITLLAFYIAMRAVTP
jgi:hypothetical protein